ncbi:hypothetical protein TWF481_012161 [Arthrobotrys musiformis]|uniref:Uncharacterized protein n=1 Tax=Arthrobotrys musiformis TaxID=47236 RepID=A0AAV9VW76_9PEZI
MSSNPFRRKQNDGTPSASGRTSLDIDQERLQQVAQQAFADGDDDFEQAGSSGPTTVPDIWPSSTTAQVATKAPDTIPEATEDAVTDDFKKPSVEVIDKENKQEIPVEDLAKVVPPVAPSDIPDGTVNQPSSVPPTPPPTRPVAPPAPPRPRRSVKRPREEVKILKPVVKEDPIVEVPTPVAPASDDPFLEAKLKAEPELVEKDDESSIYEIKKEEAEIESIKSIESEYEEDSASEISEVPTTLASIPLTASAVSLSVKTVASEPEYVATSTSPQTQAPNPFRKPTDPDATLSRQDSLEGERDDKLEALPPPIKFGNQQAGAQSSKPNRQSLDVDAFKRLMLTGQAVHTPESVSTTKTSNLSKQSLFENAEQSYTPRSSQDTGRSTYETEAVEPPVPKPASVPTPPTPKAKPPPPKPRGQRNSMPPPSRSETQPLPVKEAIVAEAVAPSQETPATPPKTPKPPAPLSRRVSAQITSSPEGGFSLQSSSIYQTPPPPPPPSRRPPSSPKAQPTTPPTANQEPPPPFSLNTSPLQNKKPVPPPARRGSKRMSAPPGRLQAAAAAAAAGKTSSIPAPPPPPIRKKSQLSQSTTEATSDPNEPPPRTSSSFDILEDLTKLQKEVDQLLGRV